MMVFCTASLFDSCKSNRSNASLQLKKVHTVRHKKWLVTITLKNAGMDANSI